MSPPLYNRAKGILGVMLTAVTIPAVGSSVVGITFSPNAVLSAGSFYFIIDGTGNCATFAASAIVGNTATLTTEQLGTGTVIAAGAIVIPVNHPISNTTLVYRPGRATYAPFYQTWAEIQKLIAAALLIGNPAPISVIIDGSYTSGTAVIPGTVGNTPCGGIVTLTCCPAASPDGPSVLSIADGASFTDLAGIDGSSSTSQWTVEYNCTTTPTFLFSGKLQAWELNNVVFFPTAGHNIACNQTTGALIINAVDCQWYPGFFYTGIEISLSVRAENNGWLVPDGVATGPGTFGFLYDGAVLGGSGAIAPFPAFPGVTGAVAYALIPGVQALIPSDLTVTANYTAHPGELILANCSAGSFTITSPTSQFNNGDSLVVKCVTASATNTVSVSSGTGATFDGIASPYIISPTVNDVCYTFVYNSSNNNYSVIADYSSSTVASVTASAPIASSGGANPNISLVYPLTSPTITGTSTWSATTSGPTTYAKTLNVPPTPSQTTPASHTNVVIATIPLPGTTGAPCARGMVSVVYDVDVSGTGTTGTGLVAGRWQGTTAYQVNVSGSPVLVVALQPVANGTGPSNALPAGWALNVALDGTSKNIVFTLTTDGSDTYSVNPIMQNKYTD